MRWVKVYLGLGSNLGDCVGNIKSAIRALGEEEAISVGMVSSLYETEPEIVVDQPKFVNGVAEITTLLSPRELLTCLKKIEKKLGRTEGRRRGPRRIDLDILLYNGLLVDEPDLQIPHREFEKRIFVLMPLAEIVPDLRSPLSGRTIRELLNVLDHRLNTGHRLQT